MLHISPVNNFCICCQALHTGWPITRSSFPPLGGIAVFPHESILLAAGYDLDTGNASFNGTWSLTWSPVSLLAWIHLSFSTLSHFSPSFPSPQFAVFLGRDMSVPYPLPTSPRSTSAASSPQPEGYVFSPTDKSSMTTRLFLLSLPLTSIQINHTPIPPSASLPSLLVSEPDPSHGEEEESGHVLTFELSPGQNVDLTNQKQMMSKWVFSS